MDVVKLAQIDPLRMPESLAISIPTYKRFEVTAIRITAISAAICTLILNRFRDDLVAI